MGKQSGVKEFMVEKSGMEKSLKIGVKKSGVAMFLSNDTYILLICT